MIGRFLLGAGLGALVGTGLLAIVSVMSPGPRPAPAAETVVPEAAPASTAAPEAEDAAPEAAAPAVADAPEAPAVAEAGESSPDTPSDTTEPAVAAAPSAPAELAGDPAPGPAEVPAAAPGVEAAAAPEAPAAPEAGSAVPMPEAVAEAAPPAGGPAKPEAPAAEAAPAPAEPPGLPPLTPEEEEMLARIAAEGPGSALPPGETAPEPAAEAAPEAVPEPPPVLTEREDDRVLRPEGEAGTLPPAPALADEGEGVTTGRLPRIGDAAEAPAEEAGTDTRPVVAHARPFDNPEGKPAFAIVLIDEGGEGVDRAALAALPFPVTFALDPTDPMVAEHAAIYRGAGQEVAMLATALPRGAQAADIEVALSAMAAALPEAVAVMDLPARAFQADRPLATLVVPAVGAGGRGLLTWDQGLNAADQVARREDIPAAVAFRDLDGAGESAPVIRRYLDRAAFKAAQEGRVTVVGRTRPETVAALLEWAVEGRAATVALAPLTAVLSVD